MKNLNFWSVWPEENCSDVTSGVKQARTPPPNFTSTYTGLLSTFTRLVSLTFPECHGRWCVHLLSSFYHQLFLSSSGDRRDVESLSAPGSSKLGPKFDCVSLLLPSFLVSTLRGIFPHIVLSLLFFLFFLCVKLSSRMLVGW